MTVTSWRIIPEGHAANAFDGAGARIHPGRWNERGTRMVYTAATLSLAMLELLVHLEGPALLNSYAAIPVTFRKTQCKLLLDRDLPPDWMTQPPPISTRKIGSDWVRAEASLVLSVPSVTVPSERNFLINPLHPDFKSLQIGSPRKLRMDPRILKAKQGKTG